jgi:hypothetical protein
VHEKNILVIGLDEAAVPVLKRAPGAERYGFHRLLTVEDLQVGQVSTADLLAKAKSVLNAFEGSVDAIVGYWDFPVSTFVPMLSQRYGTRSTTWFPFFSFCFSR